MSNSDYFSLIIFYRSFAGKQIKLVEKWNKNSKELKNHQDRFEGTRNSGQRKASKFEFLPKTKKKKKKKSFSKTVSMLKSEDHSGNYEPLKLEAEQGGKTEV